MIETLIHQPLLLLFVVAAIGYPLGRISIRGCSLGVSAVLFVGLAIGSLHPDLKLPEIMYVLGLVLFVYPVGLSSGADFVASLRNEGIRNNLLIASALLFAALFAAILGALLKLKPTLVAGLYAGSLTNTPALAGVLETIKEIAPPALLDSMLADPVVAYSVTYPVGVIGVLLAIALTQKLWHIDYSSEARALTHYRAANEPIHNVTLAVSNRAACDIPLAELLNRHNLHIIFGRMRHAGFVDLATLETKLTMGDLVVIVGADDATAHAEKVIGERSTERLENDRSEFYFRRIFVSSLAVAGKRIDELDLEKNYGAAITRVRRGDVDLLPHRKMVLELGDRVRVLTHRGRMAAVTEFFGDSYRAVSEVDILTFSLGLALGLLLGIIPIPLPGGIVFKLGFAGGPLIVALLLGSLERTGPFVWNIPYSANLTLRQLGLVLFLAGIGTRAGYSFFTTFMQGGGLTIFAAGAALTCGTVLLTLWVGHRLLKIPMSLLIGMIAGLQTQPAVLGFAQEQTRNDLPNVGYVAVYPIATITKILCAQILLALLS